MVEFEYRGYTVKIEELDMDYRAGEYALEDMQGTLAIFESGYELGHRGHGYNSVEDIEEFLDESNPFPICLPVYTRVHYDTLVTTKSMMWPHSGYIWMEEEDAKKSFGIWRLTAHARRYVEEFLATEVEEYCDAINSREFVIRIFDQDGVLLDDFCYFSPELPDDAAKKQVDIMSSRVS